MKNLNLKISILVFCLSSGLNLESFCQGNLVPNPSFEDTINCPTTLDQISNATGWLSFIHSSDYYNACSINVGVPSNAIGYQFAYDGNAYAGAVTCASSASLNAREYFGTQLSQPLLVGQKYYVSFYVSLANPPRNCWSNKIGAKFTTYHYDAPEGDTALISNSAHIYSDSLLNDTLNWIEIKGSFIADSAYTYIILGNFFNDNNTDTANCNGKLTYVFYDMVCVSVDSLCNANDYIPPIDKNRFLIYPNPLNNDLNIEVNLIAKPFKLILYNLMGDRLYSRDNIEQNHTNIDLTNIRDKFLILEIFYNNQIYHYKLIKLNL